MGYCWTLHANGGGGGAASPAIWQTAGQILDPKAAFDETAHELFEYIAEFYLQVTDDITRQIKDQIFYMSSLASPGKVGVSG